MNNNKLKTLYKFLSSKGMKKEASMVKGLVSLDLNAKEASATATIGLGSWLLKGAKGAAYNWSWRSANWSRSGVSNFLKKKVSSVPLTTAEDVAKFGVRAAWAQSKGRGGLMLLSEVLALTVGVGTGAAIHPAAWTVALMAMSDSELAELADCLESLIDNGSVSGECNSMITQLISTICIINGMKTLGVPYDSTKMQDLKSNGSVYLGVKSDTWLTSVGMEGVFRGYPDGDYDVYVTFEDSDWYKSNLKDVTFADEGAPESWAGSIFKLPGNQKYSRVASDVRIGDMLCDGYYIDDLSLMFGNDSFAIVMKSCAAMLSDTGKASALLESKEFVRSDEYPSLNLLEKDEYGDLPIQQMKSLKDFQDWAKEKYKAQEKPEEEPPSPLDPEKKQEEYIAPASCDDLDEDVMKNFCREMGDKDHAYKHCCDKEEYRDPCEIYQAMPQKTQIGMAFGFLRFIEENSPEFLAKYPNRSKDPSWNSDLESEYKYALENCFNQDILSRARSRLQRFLKKIEINESRSTDPGSFELTE